MIQKLPSMSRSISVLKFSFSPSPLPPSPRPPLHQAVEMTAPTRRDELAKRSAEEVVDAEEERERKQHGWNQGD